MTADGLQYETGAAISCLACICTPDLGMDLLSDIYGMMNRYVISCQDMVCSVMCCHVMLCYVRLGFVILCEVVLCDVMRLRKKTLPCLMPH